MSRSGEMADRSAERSPFGWAAVAAALAVSVSTAAIAQTPQPAIPAEQAEGVLLEADQLTNDEATQTVTGGTYPPVVAISRQVGGVPSWNPAGAAGQALAGATVVVPACRSPE